MACGIFRADIDVALGRADREARDGHALDQQEGVTFHDHAVGEGAAVALVGVADDVFAAGRRVGDGLPLDAGRKACAAAAAQAGLRDFFQCAGDAQTPRTLEAAPAAMSAIVGERQRIGDAAAGEGDACLALEEGSPQADRRIADGRRSADRRPRTGPARLRVSPARRRCGRPAFQPRSSARARTGRASRYARSRHRGCGAWPRRGSPPRPCRRRRRRPRHRVGTKMRRVIGRPAARSRRSTAASAAPSVRHPAGPRARRRRGPGNRSARR